MKKRILPALLVLTLVTALLVPAVGPGMCSSATSGKKSDAERELEQKKQNTLDQIDSIKSDINTVEKKIKDLKDTKSNLQTYINQLDSQVNTLAEQIEALEKDIEEQTEEIGVKTEELEAAEAEAQEQYEMMKKRIRYMYENGSQSMFELLLESENLAEMMNRAEYAIQMTAYDQQMRAELKKIRDEIEARKVELEEEKKEQEELLS